MNSSFPLSSSYLLEEFSKKLEVVKTEIVKEIKDYIDKKLIEKESPPPTTSSKKNKRSYQTEEEKEEDLELETFLAEDTPTTKKIVKKRKLQDKKEKEKLIIPERTELLKWITKNKKYLVGKLVIEVIDLLKKDNPSWKFDKEDLALVLYSTSLTLDFAKEETKTKVIYRSPLLEAEDIKQWFVLYGSTKGLKQSVFKVIKTIEEDLQKYMPISLDCLPSQNPLFCSILKSIHYGIDVNGIVYSINSTSSNNKRKNEERV